MTEHQKKLPYVKRLSTDLKPEIKTLFKGQHFKNAERTSDDKTTVGSSWKEYWQIFTHENFSAVCPFCGLSMLEDEIDGCHIKIKGFLEGSWSVMK